MIKVKDIDVLNRRLDRIALWSLVILFASGLLFFSGVGQAADNIALLSLGALVGVVIVRWDI